MRKLFATVLFEEMAKDEDIILITADLGYGLWDKIRDTYTNRFYNPGSAEQLMLGMAAGMAMEGKRPVCYSITPFLLYRPFEFIRNFMNNDKLPILLVGGGRDKDYGYLGATHWAEEDIDVLDPLDNIHLAKPTQDDEPFLRSYFPYVIKNRFPFYLNLKK